MRARPSSFAIDRDGALQLIEAKWAETIERGRAIASMLRVADTIGRRAAPEHLIVCRTPHMHMLSADVRIRVVDGYTYDDWLTQDGHRGPANQRRRKAR